MFGRKLNKALHRLIDVLEKVIIRQNEIQESIHKIKQLENNEEVLKDIRNLKRKCDQLPTTPEFIKEQILTTKGGKIGWSDVLEKRVRKLEIEIYKKQ